MVLRVPALFVPLDIASPSEIGVHDCETLSTYTMNPCGTIPYVGSTDVPVGISILPSLHSRLVRGPGPNLVAVSCGTP
jgi:hypothetical protein